MPGLMFSIAGLIVAAHAFRLLYTPYKAAHGRIAQLMALEESKHVLTERYNDLSLRHMELCLIGVLGCLMLGSVIYQVYLSL